MAHREACKQACTVGDPGSPGSERSTGEGSGYLLQYSQVPLGQKDPLEKGMATYSSVLAWRIPRTEDPGGLQSMGSLRVEHN